MTQVIRHPWGEEAAFRELSWRPCPACGWPRRVEADGDGLPVLAEHTRWDEAAQRVITCSGSGMSA
jgi:hypothetical protein